LEIQGRVETEGRNQEQTIEKAIQGLTSLQDGLKAKQQALEDKTNRLEKQQREVELLLAELERRFPSVTARSGSPRWSQAPEIDTQVAKGPEPLASRLETIETRLTAREQELAEISRRAKERISREASNYAKLCQLLVLGMTTTEVHKIMGEPRKNADFFGGNSAWYYGVPVSIEAKFVDNHLMRISHEPPNRSSKDGCPSP
jgi:hypothetical protein